MFASMLYKGCLIHLEIISQGLPFSKVLILLYNHLQSNQFISSYLHSKNSKLFRDRNRRAVEQSEQVVLI